MSWSVRSLLGEVGRSLLCRPLAVLVVGLICAGGAVAAGCLDMVAWRDDARLAATQQAAGSLVIRASVSDGSAGVATDACLALNHADGVRASGGVATGSLVHAGTSPGLGFRLAPAAGRIVEALTGSTAAAAPGLVVADEIATQVGLRAGSTTVIDGRRTTVSSVQSLGRRDPQLGRVALDLAAPPTTLTACYVEFTDDYALATLSTRLPDVFAATTNLQLTRLFATGDGTPDPARMWTSRPVRDLFAPLGLLAALVYRLVAVSRRHEYSIYLVTGSRRVEVAFIVLLGGYAVALAGLAVAVAWLALLARLWQVPGYGLQLGVTAATRTTVTTVALLPLCLTWLVRANLHQLLRERTS